MATPISTVRLVRKRKGWLLSYVKSPTRRLPTNPSLFKASNLFSPEFIMHVYFRSPHDKAPHEDVIHWHPAGQLSIVRAVQSGYAAAASKAKTQRGEPSRTHSLSRAVFEAIALRAHAKQAKNYSLETVPSEVADVALASKVFSYVLTVVFSEDYRQVVTLKKERGPAMVKGKINYPGGAVNNLAGERPAAVATRKLLEETGLLVDEKTWRSIGTLAGEEFEVQVFAATSPDVAHCHSVTPKGEAIEVFGTQNILTIAADEAAEEQASGHVSAFAPQFHTFGQSALNALKQVTPRACI